MCLILSAVGRFIEKFTNASLQNILLHEAPLHKISSVTSMSQWLISFLQSLLLPFHFCVFLSQLSELVWKLAEEISLQSASKCFQSFGPPANGNKSNAKKSRFRPNRNLTGTIYHWSVILRSFSVVLDSAKRDTNGFFKVLLISSHLLILQHPLQKSKFGACAIMGYCSFKQSR